ncbi:hypothetical protein [Pantoea allii]|uniref:hypothetical protein n=1 Tax=Pantoea allii TaxID=574096 RepID=UPI001F4DC51D|nr:hypothetical protein [Pantoea allii]MCH9298404.1 hypothetical protein [Pantoea allii]
MNVMGYIVSISGAISALCWLRAATVVVTYKKLKKIRDKIARKQGEKPNYAGVSLIRNGKEYELIETLHLQSFWNSCGAIMSAITVMLNVLS